MLRVAKFGVSSHCDLLAANFPLLQRRSAVLRLIMPPISMSASTTGSVKNVSTWGASSAARSQLMRSLSARICFSLSRTMARKANF
jgi:hypothetical protein